MKISPRPEESASLIFSLLGINNKLCICNIYNIMWISDIHLLHEMMTIRLTHLSAYIKLLCVWECLRSTCLAMFKYTTQYSKLVTMLYIRPPKLIHLLPECLCLWPASPHLPHSFTVLFLWVQPFFLVYTFKWSHIAFFFLCLANFNQHNVL